MIVDDLIPINFDEISDSALKKAREKIANNYKIIHLSTRCDVDLLKDGFLSKEVLMTETEQKNAYDMKPVILPDDEEFGQMMVSAVRYALGRMTYIVRTTTDYVTPLIPWLPYNTLRIINEDIQKYADFYDLGMECDRARWLKLAADIRAEMKERMEKFKNGRD